MVDNDDQIEQSDTDIDEDIDIIEQRPDIDELFPDTPLSAADLQVLKRGWVVYRHYDLARLIMKHNVLFKRVSSCTSKIKLYVWNTAECLWKVSDDKPTRNSTMALMFQHLIRRALKHKQLTHKQAVKLIGKYQNKVTIDSILGFFNPIQDKRFEQTLDKIGEIIPIANNKKIDLRTKEISPRTIDDYFSYFLDVEYLPELQNKDNVFFSFNQSLWNDPEEFKYWMLLNGKMVLPDSHDNLVIVWEHPLGGGGKTIFLNCIHHTFGNRITKFTIDTFKKGSKNKKFELCKLYGRTLAYCDENTKDENQKGSSKERIDLALILDISGGGMREDIDKYGKVTGSRARRCTFTILFAGNKGYFDAKTRISALERRLIIFDTEPYFRNQGEPDYDENNPNCRPKVHNLEKLLLDKPDHIFTYFVNCAYNYVHSNNDLHTSQPERFREYWNSVTAQNFDVNNELTEEKKEILMDFLNDDCENKNYCMPLKSFITEFKIYAETNGTTINFSQKQMMDFFKQENFGTPAIQTRLMLYKGKSRKRCITNIKPLAYESDQE